MQLLCIPIVPVPQENFRNSFIIIIIIIATTSTDIHNSAHM